MSEVNHEIPITLEMLDAAFRASQIWLVREHTESLFAAVYRAMRTLEPEEPDIMRDAGVRAAFSTPESRDRQAYEMLQLGAQVNYVSDRLASKPGEEPPVPPEVCVP